MSSNSKKCVRYFTFRLESCAPRTQAMATIFQTIWSHLETQCPSWGILNAVGELAWMGISRLLFGFTILFGSPIVFGMFFVSIPFSFATCFVCGESAPNWKFSLLYIAWTVVACLRLYEVWEVNQEDKRSGYQVYYDWDGKWDSLSGMTKQIVYMIPLGIVSVCNSSRYLMKEHLAQVRRRREAGRDPTPRSSIDGETPISRPPARRSARLSGNSKKQV